MYADKIQSVKFLDNFSSQDSFTFQGVPEPANCFLIASTFLATKDRFLLVVSESNTEAEYMYREAHSFLEHDEIFFFPGPEEIPYDYSHVPIDVKRDRIKVLSNILSSKSGVIFTSVIGFLRSLPPKKNIQNKAFTIQKDKEFDPELLSKKLVELGYVREEICEQFGQFAWKGSVMDIYTSYSKEPIRIEFFGDTIEEIKVFDPFTQKSILKLDKAFILPADEFILTEEEKENIIEKIDFFPAELMRPELDLRYNHIPEELLYLIFKPESLLSYFSKEPILVVPKPHQVKEKVLLIQKEYNVLYEKRKNEIICLEVNKLLNLGKESSLLVDGKGVHFQLLKTSDNDLNKIQLNIKEPPAFKGKIKDVREKILDLQTSAEPPVILITSSFPAQSERIKILLKEHDLKLLNNHTESILPFLLDIEQPKNYLVLAEIRNGFILPEENVQIWTDNDIFGRVFKRRGKSKKKSSGRAIESFIDLKENDYVVHRNHGIGKFIKIEKVLSNGKTREFLRLEYAGDDVLFVPLDQISLVQKYVGGAEHPQLDTLGKSSWKRRKDRVQGDVDKLAEELLVMYSNRMKLQGYVYPPDSIWQEEFEAEFEYEETPDQLSAIDSVKLDLESPRPMDRLVCGDVGYGKTEVAIRAAFKVIMAGRQVLFIAPTTILALQHYNNLTERFENFPITVDMVSRFRTKKEVKETIAKFSKGEVDIVVGTHALFGASMKPKNLGLLIIDEEQRFGVNHKEAIKKIKHLVDVLTLTATPIPRTLHMSLAGIRDLSIIETPPKNRQSIETYVMAENEDIIKMAIQREIDREGQVFYIYNRVDTIESEADFLNQLLPEISIGVLHGKLTEEEVEETLMDFYHKKYDLLVTTTIIESGIDMPNVNTMIVKRADMFGLSQLYQIRGRVGRSNRKAFAYFFYPPDKALSEQAEKRLNTIQEYQELGSGFKVAMRDLEIRGSGNLLGTEQSGNIMDVGFELYVQMLNEAVSKLKGERIEVEVRTFINLATNFYIPENYIPDTKQKIEFYKKFEAAMSLDEIDEIAILMEDRFGRIPEIAESFVLIEKIRTLASLLGFESVIENSDEIKFKSGQYFKGNPDKIIKAMAQGTGLYINSQEPTVLRFKPAKKFESAKLKEILAILKRIS